MNYQLLNLKQGSTEWLEFRQGKITASLIASIMGLKGAFYTKEKAKQIIQGVYTPFQNEAMKEGLRQEQSIREFCEKEFQTKITPATIQSLKIPIFVASLDGIDENGVIYEFKYSSDEFCFIKKEQKPSDKYYAQVQFQLYLSKAKECIFAVKNHNDEFAYIKVLADAKFQVSMIKSIDKFIYDYLVNNKKDTLKLESSEAKNLANRIKELQGIINEFEDKLKECKEQFISLCNGVNAECNGVYVSFSTRKTPDYKGFLEKNNLILSDEFYKSSQVTQVRIKA